MSGLCSHCAAIDFNSIYALQASDAIGIAVTDLLESGDDCSLSVTNETLAPSNHESLHLESITTRLTLYDWPAAPDLAMHKTRCLRQNRPDRDPCSREGPICAGRRRAHALQQRPMSAHTPKRWSLRDLGLTTDADVACKFQRSSRRVRHRSIFHASRNRLLYELLALHVCLDEPVRDECMYAEWKLCLLTMVR